MKCLTKKLAFTLIETIVVIGVLSLSLPLVFSIFYNILNQQAKIYQLTQVKREGDNILSLMSTTINNYAVALYSNIPISPENEICLNADNNLSNVNYFLDPQNNWFRYCLSTSGTVCDNTNTGFIASMSSIPSTNIVLNSNKVRIQDLSIRCRRTNSFSPPLVYVNFKICYYIDNNCTYTLSYQTKFKLKNY